MRQLTPAQKKLISQYVNSQVNKANTFERMQSVFKGGKHALDIDDLPNEIYDKIQKLNDTEILYQEINRYMNDLCTSIIYQK